MNPERLDHLVKEAWLNFTLATAPNSRPLTWDQWFEIDPRSANREYGALMLLAISAANLALRTLASATGSTAPNVGSPEGGRSGE
jgi:hypothetical protein